ncbi:hypothetical protein [Catenuloplanes japonicus]|uniref:hypothetical protein n=1 Tax=Catenuloplanes japonicus TaxID=33876 RepID=UPI000524CEFE|nr:hypothetical protein [Catenuloplanes japonicus]
MTSPAADAALAAIRAMWQDRSEGERAAFTSALTPPSPVPGVSEDQITGVRVRAALSGAVDPGALGEAPVLEALSPEFDRSFVDGQWRWTLRSGPRRAVLQGLAGSPERLAAALAEVRGLPTDEAGLYLRGLAARSLPGAASALLSPAEPLPGLVMPSGGAAAFPAWPRSGPVMAPSGPAVPPSGSSGITQPTPDPGSVVAPQRARSMRRGRETDPAARRASDVPRYQAPPRQERTAATPGLLPGDLARLSAVDPSALPARLVLQALAWAEPLGGFAGDLAEARRRVRVEAVAASYGALLGNGFFGRDDELARLRDFATVPVPPDDRPVPLLPVVGLGGAGKSTALAAFIAPYLRELRRPDATGPVVIVIDFDRVQFRIDAELELSFEVTRQLGNAHPVAAADFSALRYQAREERAGSVAARYSGALAAGEGAGDAPAFARDASLLVRMHELDNRAVLLILDTFEEWQRDRPDPGRPRTGGNDPEARILRWIARLRDTMDLRGLRVILSGRADVAIDPTEVADRIEVAEAVWLADLAPDAAAGLLVAQGVPEDQAPALADLVGGSPLTLRVAARFFTHLSDDERATFIAGNAGSVRDFDGDLRRELLYQRFLGHIPDPRVRRLAHPGLVLRRVTPALIRHVLAPHCGLGPLTDADAAELLERLADEVWLVKRDGDEVRHLPDVRRAMLHLMTSDPDHAATLAAIHREAERWYLDERDLSGEAAAVEAFYHRLMPSPDGLPLGPAGTAVDAVRWLTTLGDAVADLPPTAAAEARVLRGELPPLREALLLRDSLWTQWAAERGRMLVDDDDAAGALSLLDARAAGAEPKWLAQAYCDLGRWDDYWTRLDELGGRPTLDRYPVVAALASADREPMGRMPEDDGPPVGAASRSEVLNRYFYLLLLQQPADIGLWRQWDKRLVDYAASVPVNNDSPHDRFPVDQLRRILVWVAARCPGGVVTPQRLDRGRGEALSTLSIARRPEVLWTLRGDNPEFRVAARRALGDSGLPDVPTAEELARIDAAGQLGRYLDARVARSPGTASLTRVRDAFHRWDRANEAVIRAIIRDVGAGRPSA